METCIVECLSCTTPKTKIDTKSKPKHTQDIWAFLVEAIKNITQNATRAACANPKNKQIACMCGLILRAHADSK